MIRSLAFLLALTASGVQAQQLRFIEVGGSYSVSLELGERRPGTTLTILSDEGNGWYRVKLISTSEVIFVNLAQAKAIAPIEPSALPAMRDGSKKKQIHDNLRQVYSIAQQVFLEQGVKSVTMRDAKSYERHLKSLIPVDGEDYMSLTVESGKPLTLKTKNYGEVQVP